MPTYVRAYVGTWCHALGMSLVTLNYVVCTVNFRRHDDVARRMRIPKVIELCMDELILWVEVICCIKRFEECEVSF